MNRCASILIATLISLIDSASAQTPTSAFDLRVVISAAQDGDVITVPAGTYDGPVTIKTSITLIAGGSVVIDSQGSGNVVQIVAPGVTVRGFTIRGSGALLDKENAGILVAAPGAVIENNVLEDVLFGLLLKNSPDSIIRNNIISGKAIDIARRGDGIRLFQSPGALVEDNTVYDGRDVVMWFSNNVTLRRNHVSRSRYGMHFMYTDSNVLEDNVLEDNSVGAFLMYSKDLTVKRNVFAGSRGPSGYGLGLKDMDRIVAEDNLFIGNRVGVYLDNSPQAMNVYDDFTGNVFACNDIGVAFLPAVKRNRFSGNSFIENMQQVAVIGTGAFSGNDFTVDGRGNFWSDYRGYDIAGDGVGDLPYQGHSLFENLMEREPKLRMFLYSPAQQAIDMAARAFPIVAPQSHVTDSAPLMQAVAAKVARPTSSASLTMGLASGLLIAVGAACVFASRRQFTPRLAASIGAIQ